MGGTRKIAANLGRRRCRLQPARGADEDRTLSRLRGLLSDLIDPAIDAIMGASSRVPATAALSNSAA